MLKNRKIYKFKDIEILKYNKKRISMEIKNSQNKKENNIQNENRQKQF
ncbi:MAG: hypothetical protein QXH71_02465 [Candidatus Anstonellaceae archaeon]